MQSLDLFPLEFAKETDRYHSHLPCHALAEVDLDAVQCRSDLYCCVQKPLRLYTVGHNLANDLHCPHQGMNQFAMMIPPLDYAVHSFVFPQKCLQLHHEIQEDSLAESGDDLNSLLNIAVDLE
ncbi:hypothetical protein BT93_B0211 [Corymbia citriodora subsp. variegata]|nr:hypothetical protein BT93_B0211 [Corymbia citriodora subsp. variegata]